MPRQRTPAALLSAVRRELEVRPRALRTEAELRRAAGSGGHILLGPFLGEIGYELEYWIPYMRRVLAQLGVDRDRVTVMTRGGAALWYQDFAAHELDILGVMTPDAYIAELEARRLRAGDLKQLRVDRFDLELTAVARERLGPVTVVPPGLMFTRMRGLWFGGLSLEDALGRLEFRQLDVPGRPPPEGLPERYVAVKLYFNECLPGTTENQAFFRVAVERIASVTDVVLLTTGLHVDDHEEWGAAGSRVHHVEQLLQPADNLAVQTRIIAGSQGLLATYGGFSYLAPLLGVPALTYYEVEQTVPVHLDVLRRAFPDADYSRARTGDEDALGRFLGALADPTVTS
jgi:hypothetical protein